MKTPGKYRFSLQWGSDTAEKIRVGELLESLGNRKSEFMVMAVSEYIKDHPEMPSPDRSLKIVVKPSFTREQVEAIIRHIIIEERLAGTRSAARESDDPGGEPAAGAPDVEAMLRNLDLFSP
jgi:hypothetical protein